MFSHRVCCDIYGLSVQVSMGESLAAMSVLSSKIRTVEPGFCLEDLGGNLLKSTEILVGHLA